MWCVCHLALLGDGSRQVQHARLDRFRAVVREVGARRARRVADRVAVEVPVRHLRKPRKFNCSFAPLPVLKSFVLKATEAV